MKRRLVVLSSIVALLLLAALLAWACADPLEVDPSDSVVGPTTTSKVVQYAEPRGVDLQDVVGLELADLTTAEKQLLAEQSFVAVALPPQESSWKFWRVYEEASDKGLPLLVTTDSLLNTFQGVFDGLQLHIEETTLYDRAFYLTEDLYEASLDQNLCAVDPAVKEDARLNAAYFAVARALLDPNMPAGDEVSVDVQFELALIQEAAGPEESPVLGYTVDYSRYAPQDPYTSSERLTRYAKALTWYGEAGFMVNPRSPDITSEEALSLTRRALLVSALLTGEIRPDWEAVYQPTAFLLGGNTDLTVDDFEQAVLQVFGPEWPSPDDLADTTRLQDVRALLNGLSAPKTTSTSLATDGAEAAADPGAGTGAGAGAQGQRSFNILPSPYLPDTYVFEQVLWDHVGTWDDPRTFPMGLDLMSVLGSDQAYKAATEIYDQRRYDGWKSSVESVTQEIEEKTSDVWPNSLHAGWLEALSEIQAPPADGAPLFMSSEVWAQKSLNSALGGWTEFRHDTIPYLQTAFPFTGSSEAIPIPAGYVEPYPAFFTQLAALATQMQTTLTEHDLLDSESENKLDEMASLANSLAKIAERELAGDSLTGDEVLLIQEYGQRLRDLTAMEADSEGLALCAARVRSPLVTSVHTDESSSPALALREATGYPAYLYAAFSYEGTLRLFVGASYSYYEFPTLADEELTDSDWSTRLDAGTTPPFPLWTTDWLVQR